MEVGRVGRSESRGYAIHFHDGESLGIRVKRGHVLCDVCVC